MKLLSGMLLICLSLAGCGDRSLPYNPGVSQTQVWSGPLPAMRWDHTRRGPAFTRAALAALATHGSVLPEMEPRDIDTWCPGYRDGSRQDRMAFWAGMMSALAKHESTWNERAIGGGGRWIGLMQIFPTTARFYNCDARGRDALLDGRANLSCAVRIMATTVPRDGYISAYGKGVAADWGPFRSREKHRDMIAWTRRQSYCTR